MLSQTWGNDELDSKIYFKDGRTARASWFNSRDSDHHGNIRYKPKSGGRHVWVQKNSIDSIVTYSNNWMFSGATGDDIIHIDRTN